MKKILVFKKYLNTRSNIEWSIMFISFSMIWIHIGWPKNIERMKITNEILSKKVSHIAHLSVPDKVPKNLTSLFFLINYIDWLSYWCGILNDVDIDAVESIDLLKKKIS